MGNTAIISQRDIMFYNPENVDKYLRRIYIQIWTFLEVIIWPS